MQPRFRRHWLAAAILLAAGPAAADMCGEIDTVYGAAADGYRAWRGAYDPVLQEYAATHRLPDAEACYVVDDGDLLYYECKWAFPDEAAYLEAYRALASEVGACTIEGHAPETKIATYDDEASGELRFDDEEITSFAFGAVAQAEVARMIVYDARADSAEYLVYFLLDRR